MLQPFEMEVSAITKEFGSMVFISDLKGIAPEEVKKLGECVSAAIRD